MTADQIFFILWAWFCSVVLVLVGHDDIKLPRWAAPFERMFQKLDRLITRALPFLK